MSVQSEIDRIITAVGNAYSKVSEKGGTVPASQTVANLATAIDGIPTSSSPSLQSKSVTYTSNGTATVTPDSGYDGLSSVDVTVDVAGSGGSSGTCSITFGSNVFTVAGTLNSQLVFYEENYSTNLVQRNSIISVISSNEITNIDESCQLFAYTYDESQGIWHSSIFIGDVDSFHIG